MFSFVFSSFLASSRKGISRQVPVKEFASLIEDASVQRLDVRTMAEYSEGHIPGTININVLDDSFAVMADSTLQKDRTGGFILPQWQAKQEGGCHSQ